VSAQDSNPEVFDVFMCHNSEDKPAVREIAKKLVKEGVRTWLDEEQIRPGTSFQKSIGRQIESIKSAAVFVGENGFGPWQDQETQALLSQLVKRECPVIPVILPSAKTTPELPWTLANLNWVDFRTTNPDPITQLVWGITGQKNREQLHSLPPSDPSLRLETDDVQTLVPPKEKVTIEIRLPGKNIDQFSAEERDSILAALYSLLKVGEIKVTQAMAGSIRLRLELTPEDADKIYTATQNGQLATLGISETRLYPAIAVPPGDEQRTQLLVLLDRVNETWVEDVLRHSLYNEALISLGKRSIDEAVEPPWKNVVEFSSRRSHLLLKDDNITTIFDATGLLLILGEPGSGKTTTLLDLAATLVGRSRADAKERVPVVLNLSSWKKREPLAAWMAVELSQKYLVPAKIARSWLQNDYLVPLLDGLDEVPTPLRPDCVRAINEFIEQFEPAGLVVCCRLLEYQWLPKRLKLNGAICIESLSGDEVSKYLESGGSELAALREAVDSDPVLKELTQTPLMLNIMSLACQGVSGNELAKQQGDSPQERRKQIFSLYTEKMFQRKGAVSIAFARGKILRWLCWLAVKMKENSQSVFLVEGLQPSWLGKRANLVAYGLIVALNLGLIFGCLSATLSFCLSAGAGDQPIIALIFSLIVGLVVGLTILVGVGLGCWLESPLKNGITSGLIVGLIPALACLTNAKMTGLMCGLMCGWISGLIGGLGVGSLNHIILVETINWKWAQFYKSMIPGLILGLILGLVLGGIIGLIYGVAGDHTHNFIFVTSVGLGFGLIFGLIFGLTGGLISGLIGGFTAAVKVDKASPNQGIKLSRRNSLAVFVVIGLIFGLIVGLIFGLIFGLIWGLRLGLTVGLIAGFIGGLNRGGSAVIKHYSLRLIFWWKGYTPLDLIKFLDYCSKLILLKKVGGGYIFIHRMLLEYFADLNVEPKKP
jgi:eukaryotic-like serine/threonine-protein kinase